MVKGDNMNEKVYEIAKFRKEYDDKLKKYGFKYDDKHSFKVHNIKGNYDVIVIEYESTKKTGRLAHSWLDITLYEKEMLISLSSYITGHITNIYFNSFEDLFEKLEELSSY